MDQRLRVHCLKYCTPDMDEVQKCSFSSETAISLHDPILLSMLSETHHTYSSSHDMHSSPLLWESMFGLRPFPDLQQRNLGVLPSTGSLTNLLFLMACHSPFLFLVPRVKSHFAVPGYAPIVQQWLCIYGGLCFCWRLCLAVLRLTHFHACVCPGLYTLASLCLSPSRLILLLALPHSLPFSYWMPLRLFELRSLKLYSISLSLK